MSARFADAVRSDVEWGVCARSYHERMVDPQLLEQAKHASVDERLAVIGELWDSIDHESRPVSPAVASQLDDRLSEATANPSAGRSWEDIKAGWHTRSQ